MSNPAPEVKILLDTAAGGYNCYYCGLPLAAEEHQIVIGERESLYVACDDCLKSGEAEVEGL